MQEKPDAQLLRAYVQGDESAFREIVSRHADLIYSAALRQVNSDALAQDIAQSVFVDLVRKSGEVSARMTEDASLAGWLYRSTRFAVLNHLRDEHRRAEHERQAMGQLITDTSPAADWERIRPLLDEAMAELSDHDRDALLLRYFKNQDFQTVGRALGLSDDAAQKRVSRAVERLREFFARRGVTVGAGGLVILISANAVHAAPLALVSTISTAAVLAGTTIHTSTAVTATKVISMTTFQKVLVTATVAALAGAGVYEGREAAQLHEETVAFQKQQTSAKVETRRLQQSRHDAVSKIEALSAENAQLKSNATTAELLTLRSKMTQLEAEEKDPTTSAAKNWLTRVNQLKRRLEERPEAGIPELQFVTEEDWLNAARQPLNTDIDYRRALATVRNAGENKFASMVQPALEKYTQANNDQFPTEITQLKPYLNPPADVSMLERWQVVSVRKSGLGGDFQITQKTTPDEFFDLRVNIGSHGYGSGSDFMVFEANQLLGPVYSAYKAANNGRPQTDYSQLLPYATTPEQQGLIQKFIDRDLLTRNRSIP